MTPTSNRVVLAYSLDLSDLALVQIALQRGAHAIVRHKDRYSRGVQSRTQVVPIGEILNKGTWPRGVYLFTSLDGMSPVQLKAARLLWSRLKARPDCFTALNEPGAVLGRSDLLKELHSAGLNDFNVHRLHDDLGGVRLPAFVRYENLHRANLTGLLQSQAELEDAVAVLLARGERAEDLMVSEYLDYRDQDGLFRKYGANVIDRAMFGRHVFVGSHWMMKRKQADLKLSRDEDGRYVRAMPHADLLAPIFEKSGHRWGRIDYSFYKGRLQVWEVNDNPELGLKWNHRRGWMASRKVIFKSFERELARVARQIEAGPPVEFRIKPGDVLEPTI